jgi:hypothetical protein
MWISLPHICCDFVTSNEESRVAGWTSYSCGKEHVRRRRPNTPTGTSPDRSTADQMYPYGCNNLGSRPISVNAILWRQQKTHDWLGERAILAGKNKDVEERNLYTVLTKTDKWQTRPLVREGAPKWQDRNFQKKKRSLVKSPRLGSTPRLTDLLSVVMWLWRWQYHSVSHRCCGRGPLVHNITLLNIMFILSHMLLAAATAYITYTWVLQT